MMWSEISNKQLYVFWNGILIYKKWFRDGNSVILDKWATHVWRKADRDEGRRWDPDWEQESPA